MSKTDLPTTGYSIVKLDWGLPRPLRFLFIADTHLIFFDGRDNEAKISISERRHREYEVYNVGRNLPYFLQALAYVRKHCDLLLHGGDLIDMVSEQNFTVTKLLLEDIDYFFACGNHEYTHYSGQHPETDEEKIYARQAVSGVFRNNLNFAVREFGGINLVSLYNGDYQITTEQLQKFQHEVSKGLPIILMVHNPFYTSGLYNYRSEIEEMQSCCFVGCPDELLDTLPDRGVDVRPNAETKAFVDYLKDLSTKQSGKAKSDCIVKAVLAGHVHLHQNYDDILFGDIRQYVAGGGYYGCGLVLEIN